MSTTPGSGVPAVSVIMPMHNSAAFVAASIRSVQAQTFSSWELLVVDDSSTDASAAVVAPMAAADPRIRLLVNSGPRGAAGARNIAIAAARGRYHAFLDSDDLWLPAKLERQLELMARTATPLTYSAYYKVDADSAVEAVDFTPSTRVVRAPLRLEYHHMLRQDYIGFLTFVYDAEQLGRRFLPPLERRQDYALKLSILREGHVALGLADPLALYRAGRRGSLSSNKLVAATYNWQIYRHVEALPLPRAIFAFGNYAVRSGLKYLI
ncbi:glycosyltransferase family 2 protein [Georgenia sp. MJ173]|uniref:glycosyltransferase family 2 protein n=1 Tax=Georgenia sunbinii TaxID=3117728 RepID=UPI002F267CBA